LPSPSSPGSSGSCLAGEAVAESRLTVERVLVGAAGGTVVSADGSIDCPPACSHDTARGGTYTLTATAAPGCGETCTASYLVGTEVRLTAVPARRFVFTGWQGDCAGRDVCTVTLDRARHVRAGFAPAMGVLQASPRRPTAGRAFAVRLTLPGSLGIRSASCAATVRGLRLRVRTKRVRAGAVVCRWHVPRSARGALLRVRISAIDARSRVSHGFAARVG
jgi:hypothetical protein